MEVNTPIRIVSLLCGIGVLSSAAGFLLNTAFGFPSPGMVIWAVLAPGLTSYVYGRKYSRGMPKSLRVRSVLLYFFILVILEIIAFASDDGGYSEILEWGGVLVFAAFGMSLIAYLIFWMSGLSHDES